MKKINLFCFLLCLGLLFSCDTGEKPLDSAVSFKTTLKVGPFKTDTIGIDIACLKCDIKIAKLINSESDTIEIISPEQPVGKISFEKTVSDSARVEVSALTKYRFTSKVYWMGAHSKAKKE